MSFNKLFEPQMKLQLIENLAFSLKSYLYIILYWIDLLNISIIKKIHVNNVKKISQVFRIGIFFKIFQS